MMRRSLLLGVALWAIATTASAAPPLVDGRVRALYRYRDVTGGTLPFYRARPSFEASGMAPLLVRFARPPTPSELSRYGKLGFERGRTLTSGAVKVRARPEALDAMEADGVLARVSVDLQPAFMRKPLDKAHTDLVSAGAATWRRQHKSELNGEGVVVGDMDSTVDVLRAHSGHRRQRPRR
jgi:hypothetical protein